MELFKVEKLSEEEKTKCQSMYDHIELLKKFSDHAKPPIFDFLFGEKLGKHLFQKFVIDCKRDLLHFIGQLDEENKKILIINIVMFEPSRSWEPNLLYCL